MYYIKHLSHITPQSTAWPYRGKKAGSLWSLCEIDVDDALLLFIKSATSQKFMVHDVVYICIQPSVIWFQPFLSVCFSVTLCA